MINELFLKKATNIRKDYLSVMKNLNAYEKIAVDLSKSIESKMKDLEKLLEKINSNKISNEEAAKEELHKVVINIEQDMINVTKSVDNLNKKMDKLAKDEQDLYKEIKQNYSSLTDDEIAKKISEHFKKLNIS